MSVQEVSDDIKERFNSGTASAKDWMANMDPDLKGQLLTALIGAGGGGLLGGLLTGDHVGESSSDRRMRLLKNALLGALLGGGAGFGLQRGTEQLDEAMTPTKDDLREDSEDAESLSSYSDSVGAGIGGVASGVGAKRMLGSIVKDFQADPDFEGKKGPNLKNKVPGLSGLQHPRHMDRQQMQSLFDYLRNGGASPADARDKIYNIRNKTGLPGSVPRRRTGESFGFVEQFRQAQQAGRVLRGSSEEKVKTFLNNLFGTQNTTGGVNKALKGSMNTLKGINNRILPSGGAMARTGHRLKLPALLAAIGGGAYGGKMIGGGVGNFINNSARGQDIEETIREYEEAPE